MAFDTAIAESPRSCALGAKPDCRFCPARSSCLVADAPERELARWNAAVMPHAALANAGKTLFEAGQAADSVYVVRAGCLKAYTLDPDGNERVRAFYLPGDVIGLDALGSARYPATVVAVAPAQVCRIPKRQLLELVACAPALGQRLLERTSGSLALSLALAGDYTADQRVAAFLLWMERRLGATGGTLKLPMTRRDIANYLRLASETVCRVLTRFELRRWIRSTSRDVVIVDKAGLGGMAAPVGALPATA